MSPHTSPLPTRRAEPSAADSIRSLLGIDRVSSLQRLRLDNVGIEPDLDADVLDRLGERGVTIEAV